VRRALVVAGGLVALSAFPGTPLRAQVMASEESTFSQTIDGTVISLRYARPSRRGRAVLFGEQMPWGERWTPGANLATTLRTSKDIRLDGHPVPAGAYSLWIDLRESAPWQLVLDPDTTRFHTDPPQDSDGQVRFDVVPAEGPELETLLWSVDSVRATGGILRMQWGTTVVSVSLEVPMSQRITTTQQEADAVVGAWDGAEPAHPERGTPETHFRLEVAYTADTGLLTGTILYLDGGGAGSDPFDILLLPVADGIFTAGWGENGELWETIPWFIEFTPGDDGAYRSVEFRDEETDDVIMSAHRVRAGAGRAW
jgi:hypothetical protein